MNSNTNYNKIIYDKHASAYACASYWREDEEYLTSRFFHAPGTLLIAGIGGGRTAPPLLAKGLQITTIDLSLKMIEIVKDKFPSIDAQVMDVQHTMFADNFFDYVFLPFHTIAYTDDIYETAKELRRILKPGGIAVISAPNYLFLKNIINGAVFNGKTRATCVTRQSSDMLLTHHMDWSDKMWLRREFSKVLFFGRVSLQHKHHNWKEYLLSKLPVFDKSIYFVCIK